MTEAIISSANQGTSGQYESLTSMAVRGRQISEVVQRSTKGVLNGLEQGGHQIFRLANRSVGRVGEELRKDSVQKGCTVAAALFTCTCWNSFLKGINQPKSAESDPLEQLGLRLSLLCGVVATSYGVSLSIGNGLPESLKCFSRLVRSYRGNGDASNPV